jgi:hypothetical protein
MEVFLRKNALKSLKNQASNEKSIDGIIDGLLDGWHPVHDDGIYHVHLGAIAFLFFAIAEFFLEIFDFEFNFQTFFAPQFRSMASMAAEQEQGWDYQELE